MIIITAISSIVLYPSPRYLLLKGDMGEKDQESPGVKVIGTYHKNPGWVVTDPEGKDIPELHSDEDIVTFTKKKIEELRKNGQKISWPKE